MLNFWSKCKGMSVSKSTKNSRDVSSRISDLQKKIQDDMYVNSAIDRIALIVSRQIVENSARSITGHSADYLG